MDLGVHLVDLALWVLGFPEVTAISSKLFAGGELLGPAPDRVDDLRTGTSHELPRERPSAAADNGDASRVASTRFSPCVCST